MVAECGVITRKDIADLLRALGRHEAARTVLFADLVDMDAHLTCSHKTQPCFHRGSLTPGERVRAVRLLGTATGSIRTSAGQRHDQ